MPVSLADAVADAAQSLTSITARLTEYLDEMAQAQIVEGLDYSRDGVGALGEAFLKARAWSERGAALQSDAIRQRARARGAVGRLRDARQDYYDGIVAQNAKLHPELSWEERGSMYRTKMLDWDIPLRRLDRELAGIEAQCDALDVLTRTVWRARGDLEPVLHVLRAGERLAELR